MGIAVLERELFTIPKAARMLGISQNTLRWWLDGRDQYPPVIRPCATGSTNVTWGEFVEAGFLREYRKSRSLQYMRPVVEKLRNAFGVPFPLAHFQPFDGPGRHLTLEAQEEAQLSADLTIVYVEIVTGQLVLAPSAQEFVNKVDFAETDGRWAMRIHPLGKGSSVVIDPDFSFGAPTIRGIRTAALAELVGAGEEPEAVAADFSLAVDDVQTAVFYESEAA